MNLDRQRLNAYNNVIKKGSSGGVADEVEPETIARKSPTQKTNQNQPKPKAPEKPRSNPSMQLPGLVKVPDADKNGKDSPFRRVAKFLLIIGVDEAARVMSSLTPEQTEKVVLELASIRRVDKDEAAIVLAEFESLMQRAREPTGGIETARTILETAFGPERADEMLRKTVPESRGKPFEYLEGTDPDRLVRLLSDELPAVKALVLSQLSPKLAASAIKMMSDSEKTEIVIRLAKLKQMDPDILRRVDDAMREKVQTINTESADRIDGRSALAEILKRMDGSSEKAILSGLSESDPELGRDLRDRLFTVDDIISSDDRFMQETLRGMSERDLALLAVGKDERFRAKIFNNISRTRGDIVLEEEKLLVPVPRAECERVTSSFFAVMRRAWENGAFKVAGRDGEEVWVR
ncbi:MAG TPA: flagellar motor switch protein FliG [Treponemataceae bacterium]|nr:flagellar motor switch protein FliG [Treponemataceae bacterium]